MNDSYDNRFMNGLSKIVDTLVLCVLWLVCSLPVFTLGAAASALYYAFHKTIRQDRSYPVKEFFRAFKSNFKQATVIWMILFAFAALSVLACYCLVILWEQIPWAGAFLAMGAIIILFMIVWCIYLFAYQARFENTMLNVMKNSAILAASNMLWSVLLLLILGVSVCIVVWKPAMFVLVAAAFIWVENRILEKIFRRLMTQEALLSEMEADGW